MSLKATLVMTWHVDEHPELNLQTNGVPKSVVINALDAVMKLLAQQLTEEAREDVPEEGVADYLQGLINLDKEKLKMMLRG